MKQIIADLFKQIHGREPSIVTCAPGRIEFIGNHTDYNGGTVLGASIDRGVTVAVAPRTDGKRNFYSVFTGKTITLDAAVSTKQVGEASWVNYPLGVIAAMPAFGLQTPQG